MRSDISNRMKATADFWNEKIGKQFSEEEAREMHANLSGFFAVLLEWDAKDRNPPLTD